MFWFCQFVGFVSSFTFYELRNLVSKMCSICSHLSGIFIMKRFSLLMFIKGRNMLVLLNQTMALWKEGFRKHEILMKNITANWKALITIMTSVDDFEHWNTSLAAKGALANRLQHRTACKIQNGRHGALKWPTGSGKVFTPRFLGVLSNFC